MQRQQTVSAAIQAELEGTVRCRLLSKPSLQRPVPLKVGFLYGTEGAPVPKQAGMAAKCTTKPYSS